MLCTYPLGKMFLIFLVSSMRHLHLTNIICFWIYITCSVPSNFPLFFGIRQWPQSHLGPLSTVKLCFFHFSAMFFLAPDKGVLAKAIAMNSHPRKLLATDLPHRVEELQHVLHGVASAAPRRLKFSMELKGTPGMLKGSRGEVVFAFFS